MRLSLKLRLLILAIVFLGTSFAVMCSWNSTANGYVVVAESYIDVSNDKGGEVRSYGNYCSKDGTILDGGIVCHVSTKVVQFTIVERGVGSVTAFALAVVLAIILFLCSILLLWRRL